MRAVVVIAMGGLLLGACGSETEPTLPEAPTPAAALAPKSDDIVPIISLTEASLISVCRAGLSVIHGQRVDDIQAEGASAGVVTASWRAPVDGGRRDAECRVQGNAIQWRRLGLPAGQTMEWSTGPTDPVVRFDLAGEGITVTQTFPDGTTSQASVPVPVQQEAS